jgi:hypothetical protein
LRHINNFDAGQRRGLSARAHEVPFDCDFEDYKTTTDETRYSGWNFIIPPDAGYCHGRQHYVECAQVSRSAVYCQHSAALQQPDSQPPIAEST